MIVGDDYWNMRAYSDGYPAGSKCVAAGKTLQLAAPAQAWAVGDEQANDHIKGD